MARPIELEYKKVGPGHWRKWNPLMGIYSTLRANYDSRGKVVSITHAIEQPDWVLQQILDRNVAMQNSWKGKFGGDVITQTSSLPIAVHQQIMAQCGFQKGQGYDEDKFRKILNDRDYYKLKCVPGKL